MIKETLNSTGYGCVTDITFKDLKSISFCQTVNGTANMRLYQWFDTRSLKYMKFCYFPGD